jgi:hypothetical protein
LLSQGGAALTKCSLEVKQLELPWSSGLHEQQCLASQRLPWVAGRQVVGRDVAAQAFSI